VATANNAIILMLTNLNKIDEFSVFSAYLKFGFATALTGYQTRPNIMTLQVHEYEAVCH
jgi:hypothetical protein